MASDKVFLTSEQKDELIRFIGKTEEFWLPPPKPFGAGKASAAGDSEANQGQHFTYSIFGKFFINFFIFFVFIIFIWS